jgi:PAS domain S-box-containing protein
MRDAIVVADQDGNIILFNPAAQKIFGYAEQDALGQPLTMLMPREFHEAHTRGLGHYVETRQPRVIGRTLELRGRRKNGETFPLDLSLSALELEEGVLFLGTIRDATERHQIQARLVQSEKLASLGMLSAGVAHEINNPLAYVASNLAVLDREFTGLLTLAVAVGEAGPALAAVRPDLAADLARLAEEIDLPYLKENLGPILRATREGVKRVADIVKNLRGFARLDQAEYERVDLRDSVATSLELIRGRLSRRQIAVELDYADVPRVMCAPAQINQVVLNVLVNAMQAIESGPRPGGRIMVRTRAVGGEAVVEVQDDGPGIPAAMCSRIFDPFFTTKPVGEGTGLGLSITHGIVSDHCGRIEVESPPGHGALFRIILPIQGKGKGKGAAS